MTAVGARSPGRTRGELVDEVRGGLEAVPDGATVVVAVSGGRDSTALAWLTAAARPDLTLVLAHVRHGLRPDDDDVAAVTVLASWLGADLRTREVAVRPAGDGPEAAARRARYAALRGVADEVGADAVLVGHTADDQAETVLLRLVRGAGLAGVAGMAAQRGEIVRPMLRLRRADVHGFVDQEGLITVEDPTNRDPAQPRAVVRHEVLPRLGAVGGDPVAAIVRFADLARDDDAALDAHVASLARRRERRCGPVVALDDLTVLRRVPAVSRRLVRWLVAQVAPAAVPTAADVDAALALAPGRTVEIGDAALSRGGGRFVAAPVDGPPPPVPAALPVPGHLDWQVLGLRLETTLERGHLGDQPPLPLEGLAPPVARGALPPGARPEHATAALRVDGPLTVRPRRPGDRVRRHGGTSTLQDLFVDAGVPRPLRDLWPVVEGAGRVVWVPGLAVGEAAGPAARAVYARLLTEGA